MTVSESDPTSAGRLSFRNCVTGIVLAGGSSSRFGSDKRFARYRGRSLLERALRLARDISEKSLLLVAPGESSLVGAIVAQYDPALRIKVVEDREAFRGPLSALANTMGYVRTPVVAAVPADMPRLNFRLLRRLVLAHMLAHNASITVFSDGARLYSLPSLWSLAAVARIPEALNEGVTGLNEFIAREGRGVQRFPLSRLPAALNARERFANVNFPEDLRQRGFRGK